MSAPKNFCILARLRMSVHGTCWRKTRYNSAHPTDHAYSAAGMCACVRVCVCACVRVCVHLCMCACVHASVAPAWCQGARKVYPTSVLLVSLLLVSLLLVSLLLVSLHLLDARELEKLTQPGCVPCYNDYMRNEIAKQIQEPECLRARIHTHT